MPQLNLTSNPDLVSVDSLKNDLLISSNITTENKLLHKHKHNVRKLNKLSLLTHLENKFLKTHSGPNLRCDPSKLINKILIQNGKSAMKKAGIGVPTTSNASHSLRMGKRQLFTNNYNLAFTKKLKLDMSPTLENFSTTESIGDIKDEEQLGFQYERLKERLDEMPTYNFQMLEEPSERVSKFFERKIEFLKDGDTKIKVAFSHAVSASLISAPNLKKCEDTVRQTILKHAKEVVEIEPEFVLKMALYTRQELNIRTTANLLLAFACFEPKCKPYVEKYYGNTIRLPSDWIEVADQYQLLLKHQRSTYALPACLRRAMVAKFPDFDEYQLAKYNKEKNITKKYKVLKNPDEQTYADALCWECEDDDGREEEIELKSLTLKKLIRLLHISKPAQFVMAIVGKKYPKNQIEFWASGLPGMWCEENSGKRMKLKVPETWETQLCLNGNIPDTWHYLIDNKKLPFMALLRNLRNIILANVGEKYHNTLIKTLTNENAVLHSRQFPFRFMSAFEVLCELEKEITNEKPRPIVTKPTKFKKSKPIKLPKWIHKTKKLSPDEVLPVINLYKEALNKAIEIATLHNVLPIKGNTIVFCDLSKHMKIPCTTAKGLGKAKTAMEIGLLLGLMCSFACENCQLILYSNDRPYKIFKPKKTIPILTAVHEILELFDDGRSVCDNLQFPNFVLDNVLENKIKVDHMILLSNGTEIETIPAFLPKYRLWVNPELLYVTVDLTDTRSRFSDALASNHPNNVKLSGFSDKLLRFISERGGQQQLLHIETIDEKYQLKNKINCLFNAKQKSKSDLRSPCVISPSWKTVRVFISSTFRDMHGERDLLVRWVFPELRSRARNLCIDIHDIDLRWGITEKEATENKAIEICLREAANCDFFVGLLGDRYGTIPTSNQIPNWLSDYPAGASITELEFILGALNRSNPLKSFVCIRDNSFIREVPQDYVNEFMSENDHNKFMLDNLKARIRTSNLPLFENYPCRWGGLINGVPIVTGLDNLGQNIFCHLWDNVKELRSQETAEAPEIADELKVQENFAQQEAEKFVGRKTLLQSCLEALNQDNKLLVINGKPGSGKTCLMAKLYMELKRMHSVVVLPYFFGTKTYNSMVSYLSEEICQIFNIPDIQSTYLISEQIFQFHCILKSAKKFPAKLILLLDGLNNLPKDDFSWLPDPIPENISLVCAVNDNSQAFKTLCQRTCLTIRLPNLVLAERAEFVRKILKAHRKTLSESAFDNQLQMLTSKSEAGRPLYLNLACEELRMFGIFEDLRNHLQQIPNSINGLLKSIFEQMRNDHGQMVKFALSLFLVAKSGLLQEELYAVLNMCCDFKHCSFDFLHVCWLRCQKVIPPMDFLKFFRALNPLLRVNDNVLRLEHEDIINAVTDYCKNFYTKELFSTCLSVYFYLEMDPERDYTWKGKNPRGYLQVIQYLLNANRQDVAETYLTDLLFLNAKANLGLTQSIMEDFELLSNYLKQKKLPMSKTLIEYKDFIYRNQYIIMKRPEMLVQQAVNEPSESSVSLHGVTLLENGMDDVPNVLHRCNKDQLVHSKMFTWSLPMAANCVTCSKDLIAVGLINGQIQVIDIKSHKVVQVFNAQSGATTSLCFCNDNKLCSASSDSVLILWDLNTGNKLCVMEGHNRRVSACVFHKDSNTIVSVSWDCSLRVWNSRTGKVLSVRNEKSPINCCAMHPHRNDVVIGLWDTTVRIWNLVSLKRIAILRGHKTSVTCVKFSPSGSYLASACLTGEVILWSSTHGFKITSFKKINTRINDLSFLNDDYSLCTVDDYNSVNIWLSVVSNSKYLKTPAVVSIVAVVSSWVDPSLVLFICNDSAIMKFNTLTETTDFVVTPSSALITSVDFGYEIIVGYYQEAIKILDSSSGCVIASIENEFDKVTAICVMRHSVVFGTSDGFLADAQIPTKTTRAYASISSMMKGHDDSVSNIKGHRSGLLASVGHDKCLKIWHYKTSKLALMATMDNAHADRIISCVWLNDDSSIVTGSVDNAIKLWKYEENTITLVRTLGHLSAPVMLLAVWSNCIVSAGNNGNIKVFMKTGAEIVSVNEEAADSFVSCYVNDIEYMDWSDIVEAEEESSDENIFDNDSKSKRIWPSSYLLSNANGKIKKIPLFGTQTLCVLSGHTNVVSSLCTLHDGTIITASTDKTMCKWFPPDKKVEELTTEVTSIAWNSEKTEMLVSFRDGFAQLWSSGKSLEDLKLLTHFQLDFEGINDACFVGKNKFVAVSNDGRIINWSIDSNFSIIEISFLKFHQPLLSVDYCQRLNLIAIGGWKGETFLVNNRTGLCSQKVSVNSEFEWIIQVKFTTNAAQEIFLSLLDTLGKISVFVFSGEKCTPLLSTRFPNVLKSDSSKNLLPVCALLYSNSKIFVGVSDGSLSVLDNLQNTILSNLQAHSFAITCCCVDTQDRFLITVSADRLLKVWILENVCLEKQVAQYECVSPVTSLSTLQSTKDLIIILGDRQGKITFLRLIENRKIIDVLYNQCT